MSSNDPVNQEDSLNNNAESFNREEKTRSRFGRRNSSIDDTKSKPEKESKPQKEAKLAKISKSSKDSKIGSGGKKEGAAERGKVDLGNTSENRREIPVSCYDLLNGEFRTSARTRTGSVVAALVVLFAVGYAGLVGVVEKAGTASENRKIAALQSERTELLSSFGESTGLPGVTESALLEHDKILTVGINAAVTQQPDIERLYNELKKINNPNITIRFIETGKNVIDPKASKDTSAEEKSADEDAVTLVTQRVSISAESEDFDLLISWAEQLRSLTLLTDVVFSRKGNSVQIDAKFGPGVTPSSALELLQLFGSGAITSTPAVSNPTQSGTGDKQTNPSPGTTSGQSQATSPAING